MKAKLMTGLTAISVALTGYISCLIASHIHWNLGWIIAPAILPGLSFGLITAGWLFHRGWIGRGKAIGLVTASAVAYFAAYWSAFYTVDLCGSRMIFPTPRLVLFHAGMIGGLVGTALLRASLAAISVEFRRSNWATLLIIGIGAGGALCLAGIGATPHDSAGSLANPGDRVFIFVWQLLVGGYVGMVLWAEPAPWAPARRSRFAYRAAVLALLLMSFVQAVIGYSRGDKKSKDSALDNSNARRSTLAGADAEAAAQKKVSITQRSSPSPSPYSQSDKDVATFLAILAGKTPNSPTQGPQSDNLRAVERYLRSRLAGGLSESQIVELSDAIAAKFDAADIAPNKRAQCIAGEGDQRQVYLCDIYELAHGELTPPATKAAAAQLITDIQNLIPPRAVFNGLYENSRTPQRAEAKPLPPKDDHINRNSRSPGSLASEHLESLKHTIYNLTGWNAKNRESPLAYWSQVENLKAGDVLFCDYQSQSADLISRPFYFWYQKEPDGLNELLKALPPDHPIRQIGPPRDTAPASYTLALQANQETRTLVKQQEEDLEKWRAAEAKRKKDAGGGFLDFLAKMAEAGIMLGLHEKEKEKQHYEHVEKVIAESGGKQIECPSCNGSGKVLDSTYNDEANPNPYLSLEHGQFEDSRRRYHLVTCGKCRGNGFVDAK